MPLPSAAPSNKDNAMLNPPCLRLLALSLLLVTSGVSTAALTFEGEAPDGAPAPAVMEKDAEPVTTSGEVPTAPRVIEPSDYGRFERLGFGTTISKNGAWMAYSISRENKDQELRIVSLSTDDPREDIVVAFGQRAEFSADGARVGYLVGVSEEEREALQKKGETPSTTLVIRALAKDGSEDDVLEIEKVASFEFSFDGRYLLARRIAAKGAPGGGDIILRTLATGTDMTFGNVDAYAFADDTCLLAMTIDAADDIGNAIRIYDPERGTLRTLDSKNTTYSSLTWRKDSRDLAVLREVKDDAKKSKAEAAGKKGASKKSPKDSGKESEKESTQTILVWRDLGGEELHASFAEQGRADFDKDLRVVTDRGIRWSDDGATLFFSVKERENKDAEKSDDKDKEEAAAPAGSDVESPGEGRGAAEKTESAGGGSAIPDGETPVTTDVEKVVAEKTDVEKIDVEKIDVEKPDAETIDAEKPDVEKIDAEKPDEEIGDTPATDEKKAAKGGKAATASWKPLRESLKEPAGVDVWHAKDITVMPQQKKQRDRDNGFLAAWWIDDDAFVQLSSEKLEEISLLNGQKNAIATVNEPYEKLKKFGPTLNDIYRVDVRTGESRRILEGLKYRLTESPSGRYMVYVRNNNLWTYDFETDSHADMTSTLDTSFIDREIDELTDEKRAYGVGAWSKGDERVLVYDKFDVWSLAPDGSAAERLTNGADLMIEHRLVFLEKTRGRGFFARAPEDGIDLSSPLYFSVYGDRTKRSGYARKVPGGELVTLLEEDCRIASLQKAEEADVYVYLRESFSDSPDYYVAGADLACGRPVTHTNAFQHEYLWGKTQLITYKNKYGDVLQGSLAYPAGYQPGKRYPMIVHIYEKRSQNLHRYHSPTETNPYNHAVLTAGGYFMLEPDIVYRPQNPGLSAVDCVLPAVEEALSTGMIDPQRIGLMGHSWGAYQTAFLVTQTDVFAAGVAGAPLTDMISMSMNIYWSSGTPNSWIFHEGQGRMDQPFWRDTQTYINNSPIYHIDKMDTPLLIAFGTEDGAVDWTQGVEMYNAARLAEKPLVMLVYEGEGHGLRKQENQVDYHYRVLEWFGHYLKGDEPKKWITEGVSHEERQEQLKKAKGGAGEGAPAAGGARGAGGRGGRGPG